MKLPSLWDPDRRLLSGDKLEHLAFGGLAAVLLQLAFPLVTAWWLAVLAGLVYELGQWDTARGLNACHRGGDLEAPFLPGYGVGLVDLAGDALGAGAALLVLAVLR